MENDDIHRHLGALEGEAETRHKVLSMNGIVRRHYAQNRGNGAGSYSSSVTQGMGLQAGKRSQR